MEFSVYAWILFLSSGMLYFTRGFKVYMDNKEDVDRILKQKREDIKKETKDEDKE